MRLNRERCEDLNVPLDKDRLNWVCRDPVKLNHVRLTEVRVKPTDAHSRSFCVVLISRRASSRGVMFPSLLFSFTHDHMHTHALYFIPPSLPPIVEYHVQLHYSVNKQQLKILFVSRCFLTSYVKRRDIYLLRKIRYLVDILFERFDRLLVSRFYFILYNYVLESRLMLSRWTSEVQHKSRNCTHIETHAHFN